MAIYGWTLVRTRIWPREGGYLWMEIGQEKMIETKNWHYLKTAEHVAQSAVHRILLKAQESISHRGFFKLVLAGGTTPKRVYELLSEHQQEWSKWHLFIGDERCLEVDDPMRNSQMIKQTLLDKINFPAENFHAIKAELGPEQGAREYTEIIKPFLPFDLTLLGIGEDGHTASLFPGHQHKETELVHAIYHSPKPPDERISLSNKTIGDSMQVMILVTGANKKEAVKKWRHDEAIPVARVRALQHLSVLIDQDAMP